MRAPLPVLLLSVVDAAPAAAQADSARRTTGQASGAIELDSAVHADTLRRAGFDMSRSPLEQKGFAPIPIITENTVCYGGSAWR